MQPSGGQNPKPIVQDVFQPEIVSNIPVRAPGSAPVAAKPPDEDDELDKIMADVGRNLTQIGKKPAKKHLAFFKSKPKPAQPAPLPVESKVMLPPAPRPPAAQIAPPTPLPVAKPESPPAAASKPAKQDNSPILAVTAAALVTIGLIAAAYYAYK